jgi:hypothetical protein
MKAAPASLPEPAVAPITPTSQAQVSSKTILPKQSPASAGEPVPSRASDVANHPGDLASEQTQDDDDLDNGRPTSKLNSYHPVTPTKETMVLPSQTTRPAEPIAGSSGIGDEPAAPLNALSVLSEAQSSTEAANPVFHADPAHPAKSSHDGTPTSDPAPATAPPDLFTIALADGDSATVRAAESSLVVVAQDGLTAGIAPGNEVTIGTHVLSAAPKGTAIVVGHIITHTVPSPAGPPPALAFTVDDGLLSAINQNDKVLIVDGTQTFTAEAGETLTIGSETLSINSGASELVLGTKPLTIPIKPKKPPPLPPQSGQPTDRSSQLSSKKM